MRSLPLARSAKRLQWAAAALGVVGLVLALGAIAEALSRLEVGRRGSGAFRVVGLELTAPAANPAGLVLLVLAAAGAGIVVAGLRSAWRLERSRRQLLRSLPVVGVLPHTGAPLVVDDDRALAFCTGYLRPRAYVSSGALAQTSAEELRAVLAHEHEHRRRRDPLRQACATVLCVALFFLPVLGALSERSAALADLLADDAAVEASGGDPAPLAAAMLMFGAGPQADVVGIAPERVDHLLGQSARWRAPVLLAVASVAGLVALGLTIWQV